MTFDLHASRRAYRLGVLLRIILILATGFTGLLVILLTKFWLLGCWVILLGVFLVVELIRFTERSLKSLREFLISVQQGDFSSMNIIDEKNSEFQEAYRYIVERYKDLRIEKETNYHYLNRVIEHVDTALISMKDDQEIQLINRAAMELLQVPEISELSALNKLVPGLAESISSIQSGERELIRLIRHERMMKLLVRATEFVLDGQRYKIVSLQDIKSELEEQEVESWQKLVRVLTHEIMNSAIPITNMISEARRILFDENDQSRTIPGLSPEETEDLLLSLSVAESRSQGLSNFVQTTKSLTRIPAPVFEEIQVSEMFKRTREIFRREMENNSIHFSTVLEPKNLVIKADPALIEQVLINLVRNAIDALKGRPDPVIEIHGSRTREGGMMIRVCDNGPGIPENDMDNIFVPFYSTKKEGSGIGLSLSLQIMKLHKGRIDVRSRPEGGTCVSLEF